MLMCVLFRLPMWAFRFPCGFLSIAYAAPTWCPIMGSLCIPMDSFRNGMHFVSCVHVSVLSLSLSLSVPLCLLCFCSLSYADVQGCRIDLFCVAHELHTSVFWCSCWLPKLLSGVPTGCPMWPLWIPVGLMCISQGLSTGLIWKSCRCPTHFL